MATVEQIVTRARRKLGISDAEEPLQAYELQEGMGLLNDMLQAWKLEKVVLAVPTLQAVSDTVYVDTYGAATLSDEANEGFTSCLAIRMGDHYGTQASPSVVALCSNSKRAILSESFDSENADAEFDDGIIRMPSQRLAGF
jgi:hypothetical protein